MKRKRKEIFQWLGLFLLVLVVLGGADSVQAKKSKDGPVLNCDVASIQPVVSPGVTITSAVMKTTPVPYCRVNGQVITQGPGPDSGLIKFMVALPDNFNNRYFLGAEGGSAGYVPDPAGNDLTLQGSIPLLEGYAVAGTDDGSPKPGCDYSFAWNRTQAYDWDQRGIHVTAVETQAITRAYYGLGMKHKKLYRYIWGCSGGGRSANVEASYYPEDFDGANVGCPGINAANQLFFGYLASSLINDPSGWIPPASLGQLEQEVIQNYDEVDGAIDGLIWDPKFSFDPGSLSSTATFNASQLHTLQIMMNGMNVAGAPAYPGFPPTNPSSWSPFLIGFTPPPWPTLPGVLQCFDSSSRGMFGPDYNFLTDLDFNNPDDLKGWVDKYKEVFPGSGNQEPALLEDFRRAGGKIVYWHGVADNAISVTDMVRYYDELAQLQHGYGRTQTFARLFLPPGVFHGYNAPNGPVFMDVMAQAQDALVQWVEYGKPPKELVAHSEPTAAAQRTFLLCPHPEVSVFKGGVDNPQGLDVNDASNWICRKPSKKHDDRFEWHVDRSERHNDRFEWHNDRSEQHDDCSERYDN